jgi:hypothetical protein
LPDEGKAALNFEVSAQNGYLKISQICYRAIVSEKGKGCSLKKLKGGVKLQDSRGRLGVWQ